MHRKIPKAAGATALPPPRHSVPRRWEAGRRLHGLKVRRTEEQSGETGAAFSVGGRRGGGGAGGRREGEGGADGGVRQRGGERRHRHGKKLQLADGAAATLAAVASGRAGR